jgi:hypothetical protein
VVAAVTLAIGMLWSFPAAATDEMHFPALEDVSALIAQKIRAEPVGGRVDVSSWYLSDDNIASAILDRYQHGVQVRLIGDRGSIFEIDQPTKYEFYRLAAAGVPIRLRYNPNWYPEIDHWKAAILKSQNLVIFGSANFAPPELTPIASNNYDDETVMFTSDPVLVGAFLTKFDVMWNDTTIEPHAAYGGNPPYLLNWAQACANEPACSDWKTQYPNPVQPNLYGCSPSDPCYTARREPNNPMPADLIWGQGDGAGDFNSRIVQEINNESNHIDIVIYRLTVPSIANAILAKSQARVPIRLILDIDQYLNRQWPEFELTHAYMDSLWAAGVPVKMRQHLGISHMKTLITSTYATNASSNFAAAWQRDHDYFISASAKPTMYTAIVNRFNAMWSDTSGFVDFQPQGPDFPTLATPSSNATVSTTTPTLVWNRAHFATNYDVLLGTSSSSMAKVGNIQALTYTGNDNNPPDTFSWTPTTALCAGTTYFWQIVSRTNATPRNPNMVSASGTRSFTTAGTPPSGGCGGSPPPPPPPPPPPGPLPSPWTNQDVGSTGLAGSASYSNGTFTVSGAGSDIWGTADSFQFVNQTVSGDMTIVARIVNMGNTNQWAKGGIMLRESTASNAANVILDQTPSGTIEFLERSPAGSATFGIANASLGFPTWLRLVRTGNSVTASVSSTGSTWSTVGTTTLSIAATALTGLAVTSHNSSSLNTATFDNVTVTTSGPPPPPPPPSAPASPSPSDGATGTGLTPTLTWTASGATSYDVKFGAANPPPQVSTGQAAASYAPGTLAASTTYFWQIIAKNAAGSTAGSVWSFTTAANAPPPPPPSPNITIYPGSRDLGSVALRGSWSVVSDSTAAGGAKLSTLNMGVANTNNALASPTDYFDVTFSATAGTAYTLWLRLKALNNDKFNDSVWVQFSDATAGGSAVYRMNMPEGLMVNLATDGSASSLNNWGWQNTAYWLSQPTRVTFSTTGTHTIRVQVREDGVQIDQIVLSPTQYASNPPGGPTNDSTIVP